MWSVQEGLFIILDNETFFLERDVDDGEMYIIIYTDILVTWVN